MWRTLGQPTHSYALGFYKKSCPGQSPMLAGASVSWCGYSYAYVVVMVLIEPWLMMLARVHCLIT